MANQLYNNFKSRLFKGEIDLDDHDFKVGLLTSAYTPDIDTHVSWSDVSGNETTGSGYNAGGEALAGLSVTNDTAADKAVWDASNVTWNSATLNAYYAVIYDTSASDALVGLYDFGESKGSSDGDFTVNWDSSDGVVNGA